MSTVDDVAALASALSGVLAAVAGLVAALRRGGPEAADRRPVRAPGSRPVPSRAADGPGGRDTRRALAFGLLAAALAGTLVALIGTGTAGPDQTPVALLQYSIGLPFALAVFFGVRGLYTATTTRHAHLILQAATALIAATGALTTTIIATTPT